MKQDQLPQIDRASARAGSVVDPVKNFPYIYFDQHATSYSVHAFKKVPKIWECWSPSPWHGGAADPTLLRYLCYHVTSGHCGSNRIRA